MTIGSLMKFASSKEDINTNNAWGFGGWTGKKYIFDNGCYMKVGKICYRHAKPERMTKFFDPNDMQISQALFEEICVLPMDETSTEYKVSVRWKYEATDRPTEFTFNVPNWESKKTKELYIKKLIEEETRGRGWTIGGFDTVPKIK